MPEQDSSPLCAPSSKPLPGSVGTWRLMPHQVMGIQTRRAGQILVVHGQAWITWDGSCTAHPAPERDHMLQAGQVLQVPARVRVVLESAQSGQALDFEWRALPLEAAEPMERGSLADLSVRWALAWRQLSWLSLAIGRRLWRGGTQRLRLV